MGSLSGPTLRLKYFVDERNSQDETVKLVGQLGYNFNEYIAIERHIGGNIYSEDYVDYTMLPDDSDISSRLYWDDSNVYNELSTDDLCDSKCLCKILKTMYQKKLEVLRDKLQK